MPAPTGIESTVIDKLRHTIAQSTNFQTLVGQNSEANALPFVYVQQGPQPPTNGPFAVVGFDRYERTILGTGFQVWYGGISHCWIWFRVPAAVGTSEPDTLYALMNVTGAIRADMEAIARQPNYVNLRTMGIKEGPQRPEEDERNTIGDYYEIKYEVSVSPVGSPDI